MVGRVCINVILRRCPLTIVAVKKKAVITCSNYEGRTESHEQQFFCKVTCFIIDKPNTPP